MAEMVAIDSGPAMRKVIKESPQLLEEKQKSAAAKWKAYKSVQQDERLQRIVQEKPHSQFVAVSLPAACHVTRSKFVFCCSGSGHFTRISSCSYK